MRLRNPSIRLRLTIWYAAFLLIILGSVSIGVYTLMRHNMESMLRSKLDGGYSTVEAVVRNSGGDMMDVVHLGQEEMFEISRDGSPVYRTIAWDRVVMETGLDTLGHDTYGSFRAPGGRSYRLRAGSIPELGYDLTLAQETTEIENVLGRLALILLTVMPSAIMLAVVSGYLLAGRALSPVDRITSKAREITADRLSERLPSPNPDDEIGRLAAVFNDTLARLEDSFERMRRFTADASHELRTPLTSIRSVGEVALRGPQDGDSYRESIGSILEEIDRLTYVVDDLLILARGDSSGASLSPQKLDLHSLVSRVVDELNVLAEEKDQTLTITGAGPVFAILDRATMHRAIANVVHNAVRYTQNGGVIEVSTAFAARESVSVEITDNGPGIPAEERERVFKRFYRIDEARSRAEGGAGLGLAIARWAVEANGGRIEFCDVDGPGTCCRMTFPPAGA